jgi:hypothetical protein
LGAWTWIMRSVESLKCAGHSRDGPRKTIAALHFASRLGHVLDVHSLASRSCALLSFPWTRPVGCCPKGKALGGTGNLLPVCDSTRGKITKANGAFALPGSMRLALPSLDPPWVLEGRSQENDSCVALRRAGSSMCKQHTSSLPGSCALLSLPWTRPVGWWREKQNPLEPSCTLVEGKTSVSPEPPHTRHSRVCWNRRPPPTPVIPAHCRYRKILPLFCRNPCRAQLKAMPFFVRLSLRVAQQKTPHTRHSRVCWNRRTPTHPSFPRKRESRIKRAVILIKTGPCPPLKQGSRPALSLLKQALAPH